MRLEGLGKLIKIHLIRTLSRNLPACSIISQLTTLPRALIESEGLLMSSKVTPLDEIAGATVRLLTIIRELLGSNLDRDTCYPGRGS
jgi:hypothetical protein